MPPTRTPVALALAMLLLGCPKSAPAPTSVAEVPPAPAPTTTGEFLPAPYTAEQIRQSWRTGLVVVWQVTQGDVVNRMRWRVLADDDANVTLRYCDTDEAGAAENNCSEATDTWEALRQHAVFPAAGNSVVAVELETPFGKHPAHQYTVHGDDGTIRRFWFGVDTPGAPLLHTMEAGGVEVMRMEMLRREP